ncbi:hypothetical protein Ahy_B07g087700 [Arachis hypogaea]|uniref:Uncharacterized protein n=1 Tax=Arachis hypogaea TaxID=3818 RepID=A0A444YCR7_ARAHY|nr:hypothetical protein Ahy_B07g087700 [Arachis hypogaea]
MTTILNPIMADHESRFERLARQVERIARIVDYDDEEEFDFETEVDLAKLKKSPPYVRSVYPKTGDGLLNFLVQQKIKDRDVSLCPRCNAVFDAEAAAIFEKKRMKKELAHREEQARQRQPIRRVEGSSSKIPQHDVTAPLSRSQAVETVKNSKGVIICIDVTLSGGIGHLLGISMLSIRVEPEVIQEAEVEEEVSIGIRNLNWRQEKRRARGQRLLCILG